MVANIQIYKHLLTEDPAIINGLASIHGSVENISDHPTVSEGGNLQKQSVGKEVQNLLNSYFKEINSRLPSYCDPLDSTYREDVECYEYLQEKWNAIQKNTNLSEEQKVAQFVKAIQNLEGTNINLNGSISEIDNLQVAEEIDLRGQLDAIAERASYQAIKR